MALDFPWDGDDLQHMQGCPRRLHGVEVYYDFSWFGTFSHGMGQFPKGQRAAEHLTAHCPDGKKPALLLTKRDDVEQGFFDTPRHLVLVLQIEAYRNAPTDPALSYLAGLAGKGITRIGRLSDLAEVDPDDLRDFLDLRLNAGFIRDWAADRDDRLAELRDIAGVRDVTVAEAIAALRSLDDLPTDAVEAIAALFGSGADRERSLELLRAITEDPDGRYVTGEVVVERTPERMADARRALAEYQALLDDEDSSETDLQRFIEEHPWLLGLEYVRVRPRKTIPRGTAADFILERYDGFHDLLELKSPHDDIVKAPDPVDGVPPSASDYRLSPVLAQALAQAHVYRDVLTRDSGTMLRLYGLDRTRDPRVIIVIGRAPPQHRADVLRELNKSLHRVEIVPYDALAERGEAVLDNVVRHLLAVERTRA